MSNDYLKHYGVRGMHWYVRNAETLRKYAGAAGHTAKKGVVTVAKATGSVAKKGTNKVVSRVKTANTNRKATKAVAKDLGVSKRGMQEFKRLRTQTLRAHDPELVAKGMHTLTDSELTSKLARLNSEKQVRDIASAKKNAVYETQRKKEEAVKAKKERKNAGLGASLIKTTYNATINYAGKKAVDTLFDKTNVAKVKKNKTVSEQIKSEAQTASTNAGKEVVAEILQVDTINTDTKAIVKR